jgi:uncharacterized protein (TIGR00730 family)
MEARADAFVALPGGFGTMEELFEILTLRQLEEHTKPVVLVNSQAFFEPLLALFEHLYAGQFAKPCRDFYHVATDAMDVFDYLDRFEPFDAPAKWF